MKFIRRVLNGRIPQWFVWGLLPKVMGDTRTRGMVRSFRHSWFHRKPINKDPLRPELRRQLEDEFMPDVARLSEILGRDLGELWFKRPASSGSSAAQSKEAVAAS